MSKSQKFYVVWQGLQPGVYDSWRECEKQIKGFPSAKFHAFPSQALAEEAFRQGPSSAISSASSDNRKSRVSVLCVDSSGVVTVKPGTPNPPVLNSIAVDAACSGNPGVMEYQGVFVATSTRLFHYKAPLGTNNIGEFLAIVHALSYIKKHSLNQIIYSDSVNAISWVAQHRCRSKLPYNEKTADLWDYVHRAEKWLDSNIYTTEIRKWDTDAWGEVPADFGRK